MTSQNISIQKEMIHRLVRYKNALQKFKSLGLTRVFSDNLGEAAGISAALVRKDISLARLTVGNKRGGYPIDALLRGLDSILGTNIQHRVILIGCGKIGSALLNYPGFASQTIQIVAAFDRNPALLNPTAPIPILPDSQLPAFVQDQHILVAILAVPENAAAAVLDQLAAAGIRGVLNFSPVQLKPAASLVIQNINIAFEIENLFYYVRFDQRRQSPHS